MWRPAKVLKMCNTLAFRLRLVLVGSKSGRGVIRNPDNQSRFFRCISALLIVAICCCLLLPLPMTDVVISSRLSGKDSSVPFPCMRRPCGCRSAEECWRKCCCFSHKQKLAWAEENNVEVPDYVLEAAEEELKADHSDKGVLAKSADDSRESACGSCDRPGDSSPLLISVLSLFGYAAPVSSVPSGGACCETDKAVDSEPSAKDSSGGIRFVSTVQALECSGISLAMAVLSQIYLADGASVMSGGALPGYMLVSRSDRTSEAISEPPVPPPRIRGV